MLNEKLMSLNDWAAQYSHTGAAARNLIRRGKLPEAYKIGKRNWVIKADIPWPEDRRQKHISIAADQEQKSEEDDEANLTTR